MTYFPARLATLATATLAACALIQLDAAPAAADEIARPNSINVSPLGIIGTGYYAANYERLLPGGHGVLGELGYGRSSDETTSSTSFAALAGYRWHWRGRQNSGFLGVSLGYAGGTAEWKDPDSDIDLTLSQLSVTANIGKRWAWDSGLNITIRIGGGYGKWNASTTSADPDAQEAVEDLEDALEFIPIALDGELSVGYTF